MNCELNLSIPPYLEYQLNQNTVMINPSYFAGIFCMKPHISGFSKSKNLIMNPDQLNALDDWEAG